MMNECSLMAESIKVKKQSLDQKCLRSHAGLVTVLSWAGNLASLSLSCVSLANNLSVRQFSHL